MHDSRALEQYHQTRIETGSPARLVVMLYEGAIRFAREAAAAIAAGDIRAKARAIDRCMRIVQELGNALDYEAGGELSERLASLYGYAEYELLQATTFNEPRHLDHVISVLELLLSSWRTVAETADLEAAADRTAPADAPDPAPTPRPEVPASGAPESGEVAPAGLSISA